MYALRPYQKQAEEATYREWQAGRNRTLLVIPTGAGKTIVFSKILEHRVRIGNRCLILAHRGELLDQAADKLAASTGLACATEKAEQTCLGQWERIVVGSVQSMARPQRLQQFAPDYFGTIVVDEAHHALSPTYLRVLHHFPDAKILGVTATPDRGDQQNLGKFFESIAYQYTLPEAIRDGYLSPIKAMTIPLELDITDVNSNGDFKLSQLGTALDPYLEKIAQEIAERCVGRKIVVFLPLINTAKKFQKILSQQGLRAVEINGNSPDRQEKLADFESGKYDVLCNAMLLTEGWDCPSVDTIVVLRATRMRHLYSQMVGRGTRPFPGKSHLLLLDFLWHTERHDLCHPAHLVCECDEVAQQMTEDLANAPGTVTDIETAKTQAEGETIKQREKYLAKQLAEQRAKKGRLVDPIQYGQLIGNTSILKADGAEPPTPQQIREIERGGLSTVVVESAAAAESILGELKRRESAGLTSPKQIRCLEQKGFVDVANWPEPAATSMIARIAAQGWRGLPPGVNPKTFVPERF